jgi:hypothetical protein
MSLVDDDGASLEKRGAYPPQTGAISSTNVTPDSSWAGGELKRKTWSDGINEGGPDREGTMRPAHDKMTRDGS